MISSAAPSTVLDGTVLFLFGIPSDPEVVLLIANTIFLGFEVGDKRSAAAGGHWFFVMMELSFAAVFIGEWFIRLHHQRHLSMYNRATVAVTLYCNVASSRINLRFGDGIYHPFMVILEIFWLLGLPHWQYWYDWKCSCPQPTSYEVVEGALGQCIVLLNAGWWLWDGMSNNYIVMTSCGRWVCQGFGFVGSNCLTLRWEFFADNWNVFDYTLVLAICWR